MKYTKILNQNTPQSEPISGSTQVQNSAGGFSWKVDDWTRLDRFLILGSEGGSYYASERKLTLDNAEAVKRCISSDGERVVRRVMEVSVGGRAPKNDPAILVLALAAKMGNEVTRKAAHNVVSEVCRTGTHIMQFAEAIQAFGGWGRGTKRAVANWYLKKTPESLAYQVAKYQNRNGWSNRDLLRLAHPKTKDPLKNNIFKWALGQNETELSGLLEGVEKVKKAVCSNDVVKLIMQCGLAREMIPTEFLTSADVWAALLHKMPMTAMIRNLPTMTKVGLLTPTSISTGVVKKRLGDGDGLSKSRIHPLSVLIALKTYQSGHSVRGSSTWSPISQITDTLDGAFYKSFGNVEPTGKRTLLALDVSGSMEWSEINGMPGITPRIGSAALAMVTAAVEPSYDVVGFTADRRSRIDDGLTRLDISPKRRLDDNIKTISELPFGGTDCSLPMTWALKNNLEFDTFVVYTDNETWAGKIHPSQALAKYRQKTGIPAKLVVVGMVSNEFTIADPNDPGMMDVVGFDTATPNLISGFSSGLF